VQAGGCAHVWPPFWHHQGCWCRCAGGCSCAAATWSSTLPTCLPACSLCKCHCPQPHGSAPCLPACLPACLPPPAPLQVFLRAGHMAQLDKLRTDKLNTAAICIQRHCMGYLARKRFCAARHAAMVLQVRACACAHCRAHAPCEHSTCLVEGVMHSGSSAEAWLRGLLEPITLLRGLRTAFDNTQRMYSSCLQG